MGCKSKNLLLEKPCKVCGSIDTKFYYRFNKENNKSYRDSTCSACRSNKFAEWQKKNSEYNRSRSLDYYYKNKSPTEDQRKRRKVLNDEQRKHAKRDKANNRAARAKHARVAWDYELTKFVYKEAHELRKLRNELTGVVWGVDHVIPLKGNVVCGLHVWNNFMVIPMIENSKKGNKYAV